MIAFVDIDNCILDARWRLATPEPARLQTPESKAAHDAWLAQMLAPDKLRRDPAIGAMRRLAFILMAHGSTDVYYLTARNESLRGPTSAWLSKHDLFRGHQRLIMNAVDNPLSVCEYKLKAMDQVVVVKKPDLVVLFDDSSASGLVGGCAERGWLYLQVRDQLKVREPLPEES